MKLLLSYRLLPLMALVALVALVALLSTPTVAQAHGIYWEQSLKKSYGIEFIYADDSPVANSKVEVFSPSDDMTPIYVGTTDSKGYFAFIPTIPGNWIVEASDNEGHLSVATIKVEDPKAIGGQGGASAAPVVSESNIKRAVENATKYLKIGLVISIFANLALLAMVLKRKKKMAA